MPGHDETIQAQFDPQASACQIEPDGSFTARVGLLLADRM